MKPFTPITSVYKVGDYDSCTNQQNVFEDSRIVIDQYFYRRSMLQDGCETMGIIIKVLRAVNWGLAHGQVIFDRNDLYKHADMCYADISEAIARGLLERNADPELSEEEDLFSAVYPNGLFHLEDVS